MPPTSSLSNDISYAKNWLQYVSRPFTSTLPCDISCTNKASWGTFLDRSHPFYVRYVVPIIVLAICAPFNETGLEVGLLLLCSISSIVYIQFAILLMHVDRPRWHMTRTAWSAQLIHTSRNVWVECTVHTPCIKALSRNLMVTVMLHFAFMALRNMAHKKV